jgi:cell wall assembly regulator SMI1
MSVPHSIAASWSRIEAWLPLNWPDGLGKLLPAASTAEIEAAERRLGILFPEDVKGFYQLHNGTEDLGLFPRSDPSDDMAFSPLPLAQMFNEWENWTKLTDAGNFTDLSAEPASGIRADWWNRGWIPIASNGGGDLQCIDLSPTEAGKAGQVISTWHESGNRELIAPSLTEYLRQIADGLESGRYHHKKGYGIVALRVR